MVAHADICFYFFGGKVSKVFRGQTKDPKGPPAPLGIDWRQKSIVLTMGMTSSSPKEYCPPSPPPLGSAADSAFFWELVFMADTISFVFLSIHSFPLSRAQ